MTRSHTRWLPIWLTVAACSSNAGGDQPKARDQTKPAAPAAPASAPTDDRYDPGSLGAIAFAVSEGIPDARAHFTRGLLALHSFWYDEATRQFQAAIEADPNMNMAYWGAAMSRCKLLWREDDLVAAKQVLSRMPDPDRVTPREQAWILATVELLRAGDIQTSRKKFAAAMEMLHETFPDDESATFLALALLSTIQREDPDAVAIRKRAAALASSVFERNPKHPGAAHYLIHAYDTPELASLALSAAREYAKIAPAAFHARHMPAHIFSRLGMWKEAIASCQSAWDGSTSAARRHKLSANHHDFHSLNWLVEMNFELGLRAGADAAINAFSKAVRDGLGRQHRALYATQVASYLMRTGEWSRIDEMLAPLETPAVEDAGPTAPERAGEPHSCAPVSAATPLELLEQRAVLEARARAASMQHDLPKAKRFSDDLAAVDEKLRPFLLTMQAKESVARIDKARARSRVVLLARARADDRALLIALRASAVDADDESGGEANPTGFLVHEEIADTLMRLARPSDAAVEYERVLEKHPGRARSILGAARAATRAGDPQVARKWYQQLVQLWNVAEDRTEGLAEARRAVAAGN